MLANTYTVETYYPLVSRVFLIESVTEGNQQKGFLVRYTGRLRQEDSAAAYDELARTLKPYNITPLFRMEKDQQVVILVPGRPTPRPSNPLINLVLFIFTLLSVMFTGAAMTVDQTAAAGGSGIQQVLANLWRGWPFAAAMIGILGAHEFGHYLMGRHHGAQVTLPYFIPMPFSQLGTMGAFINMKEPPRNRRILLDIGIAGPLAGLVVAIPVLLLGLSLSHIEPLPLTVPRGTLFQLEGNSIAYLLAKFAVFGQLLPHPASYGDVSPVLYWIRYVFTGQPLPAGGTDVMLHPVAWAGWAGLLVTALNLIPAGQLDGGHMLYTLLGARKARLILPFILVALLGLGFIWSGWWLWVVIIFIFGRVFAEPLDQITRLDGKRKALAVMALLIFFFVFTPVPLVFIGG